MLVRLLIAVLTLAGPLPVRVCTCAAAARPLAPAERTIPSAGSPAPEAKGCGCRTKSNAARVPDADSERCGNLTANDAGDDHSHPGQPRHDRDCPAVNPAPVVAAAAPTPAEHGPDENDLCLSPLVETVGGLSVGVGSRPERRHIFRSVPLYISLLTLRN